jgi:hypothetical protein
MHTPGIATPSRQAANGSPTDRRQRRNFWESGDGLRASVFDVKFSIRAWHNRADRSNSDHKQRSVDSIIF